MQRHLDALLAFTERLIGNRSDAEDICQETFARAWRRAREWKPGRAQYRTWLFQVAHNQVRDRWRRQRPTEEISEALVSAELMPDQAADAEAQSHRVRAALQSLPERQRATIILSHYHGHTNIETAELLKVSVEAVESLLGRARRRLRELLATELEELA